jgi:hypothetical protein
MKWTRGLRGHEPIHGLVWLSRDATGQWQCFDSTSRRRLSWRSTWIVTRWRESRPDELRSRHHPHMCLARSFCFCRPHYSHSRKPESRALAASTRYSCRITRSRGGPSSDGLDNLKSLSTMRAGKRPTSHGAVAGSFIDNARTGVTLPGLPGSL